MMIKIINQQKIIEWASQRPRPIDELAYLAKCSHSLARQIINGTYPKGKHPREVYCDNISAAMGYERKDVFIIQAIDEAA